MQTGRIAIYTGAKEITPDNIIPILREAILEHDINSNRIQFLLDYDAGIQPIVRKTQRLTDQTLIVNAVIMWLTRSQSLI